MTIRVFIGWDPREDIAFKVARHSIERRASIAVEVMPLVRRELVDAGLHDRGDDPLASTEFTYTRFLTPHLAGEGTAIYCDCDFLWLADVAELVEGLDPAKAVHCVQHDHRPVETWKKSGAPQTRYRRKNWSSLMVFNAAHPANRILTPQAVNTMTPASLHQMRWVDDALIGALDEAWNWLEGWSSCPAGQVPKAIHFTRGGPWLEPWRDVRFADLWRREREAMEREAPRVSVAR